MIKIKLCSINYSVLDKIGKILNIKKSPCQSLMLFKGNQSCDGDSKFAIKLNADKAVHSR